MTNRMLCLKKKDFSNIDMHQNNVSLDTIPENETLAALSEHTVQSSFDDISSLDAANGHCSDITKRSSTMEYIRQFSFSDINLLTPIKYLFKPIKEMISPIASLPASPIQAVSTVSSDLDATMLKKDSDDIETELDLQNISLNDCEAKEKQLIDCDNDFKTASITSEMEWPLLSDFFPPSPARSLLKEMNPKSDIYDDEYISKSLPVCEETHMGPFLKLRLSEHPDESQKKEHQNTLEDINLFQANTSQEKIGIFANHDIQSYKKVKEKAYNSSYNNSDLSFNFPGKLAMNILHTKMVNFPKHVSYATPTSSPILLNMSKQGNTYSTSIYKNISSEMIMLEGADSVHVQKPKDSIARTYWLMKILQKTLMPFINKSKGFYLTPRLFVSKDIWYVKDIKIKGEDEKIKQDDLQSLIKELSYLGNMVDLFRFWLLKKFGTDVVEPKKRFGIAKFTSKSKFLIKNLPPEKFNTSKYGLVQFDGPRKMYLTSIYRLFESAQVIDQLSNSLDLHDLPIKAQDHIHETLKNISDFFENVICHFVLVDINVLLDHFIKQLLYGDDYNSIIGPY
ncbi:unnamed protein product [Pneumocystis jirovecii]|uniref:Uncharacterized protein n=1 Tax=Pneumocystis jirovecii TaxID=42068 RepID=L0PFV7_PNEJI|nr:unnamed protein product [Pneumocystis jirovecii]